MTHCILFKLLAEGFRTVGVLPGIYDSRPLSNKKVCSRHKPRGHKLPDERNHFSYDVTCVYTRAARSRHGNVCVCVAT